MPKTSRARLPILCTLPFLLIACASEAPPEQREAIRPVKTLLLEEAAGLQRTFPASIEASRRVELSFRVPGKLDTLQVQEGDQVFAGQVLATLDPTDYELTLESAEAFFARALADWERAASLVVDGHLSRADYDRYESIYQQAEAQLKQARLDLGYTELRAPIDSTVARRYIQNFEEVQAKQEVFSLRDNSELEVRVNIPETLMSLLALDMTNAQQQGLFVTFPAASEERFALSPKEFSTRADEKTQTFEARFTFEAPTTLNVLPGMSAVVVADLSFLDSQAIEVTLPATALDRRGGETRIWLYDPESGHPRPVAVSAGPVISGEVEIQEGVSYGDHIIIAGAEHLDESMQVYEMRKAEQADG